MSGGEAAARQNESRGKNACANSDDPRHNRQADEVDRLCGQDHEAPRHGDECGPHHSRAVFVADGKDGKDGDHRLTDVDPSERQLREILITAGRGVTGGPDHSSAEPPCEHGYGGQQPAGACQGA